MCCHSRDRAAVRKLVLSVRESRDAGLPDNPSWNLERHSHRSSAVIPLCPCNLSNRRPGLQQYLADAVAVWAPCSSAARVLQTVSQRTVWSVPVLFAPLGNAAGITATSNTGGGPLVRIPAPHVLDGGRPVGEYGPGASDAHLPAETQGGVTGVLLALPLPRLHSNPVSATVTVLTSLSTVTDDNRVN